jgi:hypothetical protein
LAFLAGRYRYVSLVIHAGRTVGLESPGKTLEDTIQPSDIPGHANEDITLYTKEVAQYGVDEFRYTLAIINITNAIAISIDAKEGNPLTKPALEIPLRSPAEHRTYPASSESALTCFPGCHQLTRDVVCRIYFMLFQTSSTLGP